MVKKGSYQRKKERKNRVTAVLCILLLTFVLFLSSAEFIRHWIVLATWDTGGVLEYQGEYTLKVQERMSRRSSRFYYTFTLDNGYAVSVASRYLQDEDRLLLMQDKGEPEELIVRYTRFPALLQGKRSRSPVSIASGTDGMVYYDKGKARFRAEMVLFVVLSMMILLLLVPIAWLSLDSWVKRLRTRLRQKRRRKQKNKT